MALYNVNVAGKDILVDAHSRAAAKAFGLSHLKESVVVREAKASDLAGVDIASIAVVAKKGDEQAAPQDGGGEA